MTCCTVQTQKVMLSTLAVALLVIRECCTGSACVFAENCDQLCNQLNMHIFGRLWFDCKHTCIHTHFSESNFKKPDKVINLQIGKSPGPDDWPTN